MVFSHRKVADCKMDVRRIISERRLIQSRLKVFCVLSPVAPCLFPGQPVRGLGAYPMHRRRRLAVGRRLMGALRALFYITADVRSQCHL